MTDWLHKLWNTFKFGKDQNRDQRHSSVNSSDPFEGLQNIRFGRYSDNNKTLKKTKSWHEAEDFFKEKNYDASLKSLFEYLKDDSENNVQYTPDDQGFKFELIQGSRKVYGAYDGENIVAKVPLAVMQPPRTAAMRRLLELNYSLYYSRSAMDENNVLYMLFDTNVKAASPDKLYYGLRELAIKADRQDDLLLADFNSLTAAEEHIDSLPEWELEIKYKYFQRWISDVLERVEKLNPDSFAGAIAYMMLSVVFRIDFLITPEAKLLADLERINSIYWEKKDDIPLVERNKRMKDEVRKLLDIPKEVFAKTVYRSKGTFAISTPPKADKVREYINNAHRDGQWYIENKYPHIALNITEYGVLYSHFIYSMPRVQTDLTIIYMAVLHPDFFEEMGLKKSFYNSTNKEFNKDAIETAIEKALDPFKDKYRNLKWNYSRLNYDSLYDFGVSFSEQMANLNLEIKRTW